MKYVTFNILYHNGKEDTYKIEIEPQNEDIDILELKKSVGNLHTLMLNNASSVVSLETVDGVVFVQSGQISRILVKDLFD